MIELLRLVLLQALFGAYRLVALPDAPSWLFLVPLPEILLIDCLRRSPAESRAGTMLKTVLLIPLIAALLTYNAGETFYRLFYLQHFNPFADLALIPGLVRLLAPTLPLSDGVVRGLSVSLTMLVLAAVSWVLARILRYRPNVTANPPSGRRRFYRLLLPLSGLLLFLVLPAQSPLFRIWQHGARVLAPKNTATASAPADRTPPVSVPEADDSATKYAFPGIRDADIHLVVVESYGATLLERPEYREPLRTLYAELERELEAAAYIVLSGTVRSPAFGGRSWLADATLLTGTSIADQTVYDRIATEGRRARLLALTGDAGYSRLYAAPGTRTAPEAWRLAYPFDRYLLRYDFEYAGPFVSFGAMPDQYLLDYAARALRPGEKDFALYLLVSSHVPFEVIPVYREGWDFPLSGKEFETETALVRFDNKWLGGTELAKGYLAGIDYSLRSAVGLFTRRLQDLNVGIIIGDHQPRKPVSHASADYQVPFHVILPLELYSERVAANLAFWKLTPGLEARPDPAAPGMESIVLLLEKLFWPDS